MADQQPPELPQLPQIPTDHLLPSEAGESHPMMDAALSIGHSVEPHADLALRMLYDEQTRLRTELNDLRKQSEEKKDDKKEGEKEDDQGGDDKEKEEGGDDKKDGEKKDGDDKKEEKHPLIERVHEAEEKTKGWTRQHPIATVAIIAGVSFYLFYSGIGAIWMPVLWILSFFGFICFRGLLWFFVFCHQWCSASKS